MSSLRKKIILSGGGTGGSVTPLFQVYRSLKNDYDFLFVGTYTGIEKSLVAKEGLPYRAILSGKWRRYFSFLNFIDIFKIFFAFWQSLFLLIKERPHLVLSAGGFVAVPLSLAAWFLRIPVIIHQQDVVPGLANKIMAKIAKHITVTFPSALDYYGKKAKLIGNLSPDLNVLSFDKKLILDKYNITDNELPLLLVLGGGTGSLFINKLIRNSLSDLLSFARVVHISGKNEESELEKGAEIENYTKLNFIDHQDVLALIKFSDLVVSRCGLGVLTELAVFKKAAILIPMPNSHQEFNALEFEKKQGAIVLTEEHLSPIKFVSEVKRVLDNNVLRQSLAQNISGVIANGNEAMTKIIKDLLN